MSRASSRKQKHTLTDSKTAVTFNDSPADIFIEDEDDNEVNTGACAGSGSGVTSYLNLKPTGTLDKQMVLRRIRRRKRMNMVKSTFNSLFSFSAAGAPPTAASSPNKFKWIDDPFAAP